MSKLSDRRDNLLDQYASEYEKYGIITENLTVIKENALHSKSPSGASAPTETIAENRVPTETTCVVNGVPTETIAENSMPTETIAENGVPTETICVVNGMPTETIAENGVPTETIAENGVPTETICVVNGAPTETIAENGVPTETIAENCTPTKESAFCPDKISGASANNSEQKNEQEDEQQMPPTQIENNFKEMLNEHILKVKDDTAEPVRAYVCKTLVNILKSIQSTTEVNNEDDGDEITISTIKRIDALRNLFSLFDVILNFLTSAVSVNKTDLSTEESAMYKKHISWPKTIERMRIVNSIYAKAITPAIANIFIEIHSYKYYKLAQCISEIPANSGLFIYLPKKNPNIDDVIKDFVKMTEKFFPFLRLLV